MVDPENITRYDLTDYQLKEHALFWICAAGKNGRTAARSLDKLLNRIAVNHWGPMQAVLRANVLYTLPALMKDCGIGCYTSKSKSFVELSKAVISRNINLRTCTADELEQVYGIGMKTSRCFILHSRYGARYAGLDTHMLKYLKLAGIKNVPKSTPSSKKQYLRLEKEFLKIADLNEMLPADFDLAIWNQYSVKINT